MLGGCSTYPDFGDWSYLWRDLGLSRIFGCWTGSRQSDWTVLGKISWKDKYHSPSGASCLTDPSQQDVGGDETIFPTTRITHCYPFSTAAAQAHSQIKWMVEQRFDCLKLEISSVYIKRIIIRPLILHNNSLNMESTAGKIKASHLIKINTKVLMDNIGILVLKSPSNSSFIIIQIWSSL